METQDNRGRSVDLGRYRVTLNGGAIFIFGPDQVRVREARTRLQTMLETVDGCTLLGRLLNGRTLTDIEKARGEFAVKLGLPQPVAAPGQPAATAAIVGMPVDYDENQAQIVAYRLPQMCTRTITELHGICQAIVADNQLTGPEIAMIRDWLAAIRPEFREAWPISDLSEIMRRMLADGKVTFAERDELMAFLKSIAADPKQAGIVDQSLCDRNPAICFEGKTFLLTGKLRTCKRAEAWEAIKERDGQVTDSSGKRVDYLVIGELGTEAYQYSRYGRKIEEMKELRRVGHKVLFVAEGDFVKALARERAAKHEKP